MVMLMLSLKLFFIHCVTDKNTRKIVAIYLRNWSGPNVSTHHSDSRALFQEKASTCHRYWYVF